MLEFTVERGTDCGMVLVSHKRRDGSFLASKHKNGPHKRIGKEEDLVPLLKERVVNTNESARRPTS